MKRRKRIWSLALALVLTLGLCTAACAANTAFTDVPAGAPYAEAAEWCRENGLMAGVGNNRFDPDGTLTRAMVATCLYSASGRPAVSSDMTFLDTPTDAWYAASVVWAVNQKLFAGYGNGRFGPDDPVTQEQLRVVLGNYTGSTIAWTGDPTPAVPATRAEVAVALMAALKQEEQTPAVPAEGGKVLVAYFSCTNNTKGVAEKIAQATGGDLFMIVPETPYTAADLNYNTDCRANREQNDDSARPAIAASCKVENWDSYDVVFWGWPIWWGIPPKIMQTFAEQYDWSGKTVIGFCTSGSSPYSYSGLSELTPGAGWAQGRRFSGSVPQSEIDSWVKGFDFRKEEADVDKIKISFNGHNYSAALEQNSTVDAFVKYIRESGGSITLSASDYGGWEKVASLGISLPANNTPTTTSAGDFVLYSGNQIVLFYGSNSWSYTRLGKLEGDLSNLKADLGSGDVSITYALP